MFEKLITTGHTIGVIARGLGGAVPPPRKKNLKLGTKIGTFGHPVRFPFGKMVVWKKSGLAPKGLDPVWVIFKLLKSYHE